MNRRTGQITVAIAGLILGGALTAGCGHDSPRRTTVAVDDHCDVEDLTHQEDECGYWDDAGVFVLYPWVLPNLGGRPPAGRHPVPPAGVRPNPPATYKPTTPKPVAPKVTGNKKTTRKGKK